MFLSLLLSPSSSSLNDNKPFPSLPQPPFQSEAKCKVFVMKISFCSLLNLDPITITKILHLDSLWKRDWGELGNVLLPMCLRVRLLGTFQNKNIFRNKLYSGYSALESRIAGMEIQVFQNENSSQTKAYSHYSNYSYSELIPNERTLKHKCKNFVWFNL